MNTIPSHDVVLRRVVDRVTATQPPNTAADLAARLRPLYPRVAVFERQLSGERSLLYVYRDGRYEPERPEQWWAAPGVACAHFPPATGRLTSVSPEWAKLMRAPEGDLVGRHLLDFVLPEARAAAQAMLEVVTEELEVRSEALLARPDGSTVALAFRATRTDGEIEMCVRALDA